MAPRSSCLVQAETASSAVEWQWELPILLMVDDDFEDGLLVKEAVKKLGNCAVRFVLDGDELLDYLNRRGKYAAPKLAPTPAFILLDLKMPRKRGDKVLAEIKAFPSLREIPVIVFTSSDLKEDRNACRKAGADDFIVKPSSFDQLVETLARLVRCWSKEMPVTAKAVAEPG